MLTFSVNEHSGNEEYVLKVKKAIEDNIMYFKKFNGANWEDAVHKTFLTAIENQNDEYDNVEPYIKNLARNILKTKDVERAYDTITEDGETSYPFLQLTSYIDESILVDNKEITDAFKELYLKYTDEFIKLEKLFKQDAESKGDMKITKSDVIKTPEVVEVMKVLCQRYSTQDVFNQLYQFLKDLPEYLKPRKSEELRIVDMKKRNPKVLENIPDIPLIKDIDGNYLGIDKATLSMEKDPDYIKWDTISNTASDILKIDITPLMDYMYQQVFVPEGVHTKHIRWCGNMYSVITPAGERIVNIDRNVFMNKVRVELIENLIDNRFNTIIALSPDSVYLKPTRIPLYTTIRLILCTGTPIDLPVTIHIKKRH